MAAGKETCLAQVGKDDRWQRFWGPQKALFTHGGGLSLAGHPGEMLGQGSGNAFMGVCACRA